MGKDSGREKDTMVGGGSRKSARPVSASPYSENYRPPIDLCQRHLINHRLLVSKLTRRELEDKYISLCDENYSMKKRFLEQEEQLKRLKTRLMRLSSESTARSKSRLDLSSSEHYNKLHDLEIQRRELHEKLEALRRATTFEEQRVGSASRSAGHAGATRHAGGAGAVSYRRSKSAHRAKEREPRRECKSSSPSNDDYDEEVGERLRRLRHRAGKDRASTDRTEDEDEGNRSGHRKSYGADDEEDDEDVEEDDGEGGAGGDEDGEVDEDRDVVSCGGAGASDDNHEQGDQQDSAAGARGIHTKHSKDRKGSRASRTVRGHCPDCERHRTEHLTRETDLVKMKLNMKYLHKELQNEKEKSALLARQLEEKLSYEIMKRNAAENMEIVNLNRQVDDLAKELQRQVDEQKRSMEHEIRKQGDLEAQIRKEKDKNIELFEECERLKKSIEKLKENMSEVEIERDFLRRQQENFTKIVDENKLLKYQLDELRRHNEELLKQIDSLREEELVTKESQRELLEKLKTLQQDNDTLSVMLEGLRTENEMLAEERSQLEISLKSLEASPIKEIRPMSPQKPPAADASVQTDADNVEPAPSEGKTSFLKLPVVSREPSPQPSGKVDVAVEDTPPVVDPPTRRSRMSGRENREQHEHAMAEAARQVFRQVGSVTRMIPKLSQIMNNRIDEPVKPSNVELLIANTYPATLEKTFRDNDRFYDMQNAVRRRNVDRSSISSTASGRRKISFVESIGTDESSAKDEDNSVQENYARYFDINRLPSMWHTIVANPMPSRLSTPSPSQTSGSPDVDVLTIEVRSLRWHESALERLLAAKVRLYYVEFAFLDLHGHRLETVPSANLLSQPDGNHHYQLYHEFNFPVRIEVDAKAHGARREQVKAILGPNGNDAVRFVVVNEVDSGFCEDIGYASVSLKHELLSAPELQESVVADATIYDFSSPHDELGVLRIVLGNVKLLRSLMDAAT
uniref:RPGRIP1 C-terminal domain-containing protein n=1 Tax=Anopheles atroparvus TaxID=41427 RepID=A0A182J5K5_ANOAO